MNDKVHDPVCGMTIDAHSAVGTSRFEGRTYHFCSRSCETKFDAAPAKYASASSPAAGAGSCCSPSGSCHTQS